MEEQNELKFYCPHCLGEVDPEAVECSQCRYVYSQDTLNVLTSQNQGKPEANHTERRNHARVRKAFRLTYRTPNTFKKSYLHDIGTGGLFIKTDDPLMPGEMLNLRLFLPDEEDGLKVVCEVVWVRSEERVTVTGKHPQGMGVRFVNPPEETIERIERILNWTATGGILKVAAAR